MFVANLKADAKNAWKSFTVWFNGIATAFSGLMLTLGDQSAQLKQYLPAFLDNATVLKVVAAIGVGNLILRFKTNKALRDK